MEYAWPTLAVVLAIHDEQLAEHRGLSGLRDLALLDAALSRPLQHLAFADDPDIAHLAAVLGHGFVANHPFADGNKRTSAVVTELFLGLNGYDLAVSDAEIVEVWLAVASGEIDEAGLAGWLRANIKKAGA